VNFGHRPWWYGGHFCQKAGKSPEKMISKRINLKKYKLKKPGGGSKIRNHRLILQLKKPGGGSKIRNHRLILQLKIHRPMNN
jgi:hypothetical protein